ncbi:MAG: hypothetical protein JST54_13475 [Deltaproteobacteria bacterium]|nr:hypothetical protein [Deltaproteobacteria bacterium]
MRTLVLLALALTGCATMGSSNRSNLVGPPKVDRCAMQPANAKKSCAEAMDVALRQVKKLMVDDQVCIDGEHELADDSRACQVRAFVEGAAPNAVQLEIRSAPPDSKYVIDSSWWYDERALAEVQLRALGYTLPDDAKP